MIRLERLFTPLCLSPSVTRPLVDEFRATKAAVWQMDELKRQLLESSQGKCAYCECRITEESKYLEVEHFLPKDTYPDEVLTWDNLLPSCKRCNGQKGTHDTGVEPIVDPYRSDPRDHFVLRAYRFYATTIVGKDTIGALNLNDQQRVVNLRYRVGEAINESLETAWAKLALWRTNPSAANRNRVMAQVRAFLTGCQPAAEYAATAATMLHHSVRYAELRQALVSEGLWEGELNALHDTSLTLVYAER